PERSRHLRLPRGGGAGAPGVGATAGAAADARARPPGAVVANHPRGSPAGDERLCGGGNRPGLPAGAATVPATGRGADRSASTRRAVVFPRRAPRPGHGTGPRRGAVAPGPAKTGTRPTPASPLGPGDDDGPPGGVHPGPGTLTRRQVLVRPRAGMHSREPA